MEVIKLYTSLLSQFFTLSDPAIADSANRKRDDLKPNVPSFVPTGSSVLGVCFFSEKLVEDVAECTSELAAVDVGGEAGSNLKGLLDALRWRLLEAVGATWTRGMPPCVP